jgi:Sulfotransferase family
VNAQAQKRETRPVFVVGCHRSGTNLLYDMLLSSGAFAVYRGYIPVYKMLVPRYGSLHRTESRRKIVDTWLHSKGFRRSGLDAQQLAKTLMESCRNGGDFIRVVMDGVAREQGMSRWAVYDADNVLYIPEIKADIPEALFVHIVRDGRDIALSLRKMGEFRPVPWRRRPASLPATALYWRWMVETGRKYGRLFPNDYIEVRYEELVNAPQQILQELGRFLGSSLDYAQIQTNKLGRMKESNSSFADSRTAADSSPVNRWKKLLSEEEVAGLETLIGDCLEQFGYELTVHPRNRQLHVQQTFMRNVYPRLLATKLWLKTRTLAGRFSNLSALELAEPAE